MVIPGWVDFLPSSSCTNIPQVTACRPTAGTGGADGLQALPTHRGHSITIAIHDGLCEDGASQTCLMPPPVLRLHSQGPTVAVIAYLLPLRIVVVLLTV